MRSNTISATTYDAPVLAAESLSALHQASLNILTESGVEERLHAAAAAAHALLEADYAIAAMAWPTGRLTVYGLHGLVENGVLRHWLHEEMPATNAVRDVMGPATPDADQAVWLATPLTADGVWLGNLYVGRRHTQGEFAPADRHLLIRLAAVVGLALKGVRELEAAETRNRQFTILHNATVTIARDLSLDKVLQHIVNAARELVGARYAALGVPDGDDFLETFVHSGLTPNEAANIAHPPHGLGLLGEIIRQRRSIRLARLQDHPASAGFPPGHPSMVSFLGVPILGGGEALGNLYLTEKIGAAEFSVADQEMVEMLAAHAAVAIHNARLYHQVERLAVLEERTRIGMDLHDGVIQSIFAVGLTLESSRLALGDSNAEASQLLDMAISGLNDAIQDIRNYILDLRPRRFRGNLEQGLAQLVREFQANTLVPVQMDVTGALENLPTPIARTVFLATQEALANVARHAKASQVKLSLLIEIGQVELLIADNGRGFNAGDHARHIGHGLANMQARAEELRGAFNLHTAPGQGTIVALRLPMR